MFEKTLSDMIQFLFNFYVIEIRLLDLQIFFCAFSMKKMISQWEHHILLIKACDAIRPALSCCISMIISVHTLCGFTPLIIAQWEHFSFAIFANFDVTCLIFPFRCACFPIKIDQNAQWEHLFFDGSR